MNLLFANDRAGEHAPSYYAATADAPGPWPRLEGEVAADVCVIGGGFTGLSAALHLAEAGHDTVLVEAHRVGFGASGRNGGQVASGFNLAPAELARMTDPATARALWEMTREARALTIELAKRHAPDAGYRPGILYVQSREATRRDWRATAESLSQDYGYDAVEIVERDELGRYLAAPRYVAGVLDRGGGQLHPLRYAFGLARAAAAAGTGIHERSVVHRIEAGDDGVTVRTDRGQVRARHAVLATNGYGTHLVPEVAARVMPINSYVVASEPLGPRADEIMPGGVAVADDRFVVNYFRLSEDGRLIFGGGEGYGYRFARDIAAKVRPALEGVFPQLAGVPIDYAWGGTLAITLNRLPHLARPRPTLWSAAGYSGHGVALSGFAGALIARAIGGDVAGFDRLAALPSSSFPGGAGMRAPLLRMAMTWYALRDRLGI